MSLPTASLKIADISRSALRVTRRTAAGGLPIQIAAGLIAAFASLMPAEVAAQSYPARTVTVVVPFPPGGSVDGVARILVQKLNESMGQYFIVENRAGGASGTVGANAVARAAPDGYTLLVSASVHVINPFLYRNVPYDVVNDFTPVTLLAEGPLIVSTTPRVAVGNLRDFFELVRREPGKFTFGATTLGSASHLAIELPPTRLAAPLRALRGRPGRGCGAYRAGRGHRAGTAGLGACAFAGAAFCRSGSRHV